MAVSTGAPGRHLCDGNLRRLRSLFIFPLHFSLGEHYDDTLLSFSALLSDPETFRGGGTRFPNGRWVEDGGSGSKDGKQKKTTQTLQPSAVGDLVAHCGRLTHSGLAVTAGLRYLLVGFVRVSGRRVDAGAYDELLKGKGRLTHAKRLATHYKLAGLRSVAARGAAGYQAAPAAQLEYEYAARALGNADEGDDIKRPPEFIIL